MAEASPDAPDAPADAAGLMIRRIPPQERPAIMGLLLTGRARAQDPTVTQFLAFAAQQNMVLDELWAGYRNGEPVASILLLPAAGHTAMAFVSPALPSGTAPGTAPGGAGSGGGGGGGSGGANDLAAVLTAACKAQDPDRLRMVQGILDPWQERERQALEQAGFRVLANLVYMQRKVDGSPAEAPPLELDGGIQAVHWSEAQRPRFAEAILASYQQTLDCPELVGLRWIDDIIAGHMASGEFQPDLWFALSHEQGPVGVMLLSRLPQRQAIELVYLGLAPPWRGRGLGARLLKHALALARQHALPTMLLAVDDHNKPAMRLYQSLGFVAHRRGKRQ